MATPENTFIAGVHKHLPAGRQDPYWMKNNNLYTSGIWDCWYSGQERDLWVEYKFEQLPKRADTIVPIALSALQIAWGKDRHEEGRNLAVIVGTPGGGVIFSHREWEHPITAAEFVKRVQTRAEIAAWIMQATGGLP